MKAILICPEHRTAGGIFHRMQPLALMPVMGRSLLDHALTSLKKQGVQEVEVLASDRPAVIREALGKGDAWGLKVGVTATPHELTADVAELRHGTGSASDARPQVLVLDSLPGMPDKTLWTSDVANFEMLRLAVDTPELAGQLTMQELSPGVWVSTRACVSKSADLTGPVWIGPFASIGAHARIGPNAIVEARAFVDGGASVKNSWIGPATYVGSTSAVKNSCAWGNGLLNWQLGSFLEVRDGFLLNDISRRTAAQRRASWGERLLALVLMILTSPMAFVAMLRSRLENRNAVLVKRIIVAPVASVDAFTPTCRLPILPGAQGLFRRWPELWLVVRGDMALVGNRPLTSEEARSLRGPLGQIWLEVPAGVFSLADAEGADAADLSACLAHAAFFSATRSLSLKLSILKRCLWRFVAPVKPDVNLPLNSAVQSP